MDKFDWKNYYHLNDDGELVNSKNGKICQTNIQNKMIKGVKYSIPTMNLIWYLGYNTMYPADLYRIDKSVGYRLDNISKEPIFKNRTHERTLPKYIYSRQGVNGIRYEVIIPMNKKLYNVGIFRNLDDAISAKEFVLDKNVPVKVSGKLKGYIIGEYDKQRIF